MEEMENSPFLSLCSSGVWKEIRETKPLASTQTLSWNAVTMATVRASQSPSLHGGGTSTQISKLSPREAPFPGQPKGQTKSQAGLGLLPPPASLEPSPAPLSPFTYSQRIGTILRLGQATALSQEVSEVERVDMGVRWSTPCEQFPQQHTK